MPRLPSWPGADVCISSSRRSAMSRISQAASRPPCPARRRWIGLMVAGLAGLLAGCSGMGGGDFGTPVQQAGPPQAPNTLGAGQIKVALILPLSAAGNLGAAALSLKNAAEMALAEINNPNIQLLIKDD